MFGRKDRIIDPYNTMGTAKPRPSKPSDDGLAWNSRPRTREENARYDRISRKVIKNQKVDPHDFKDTTDYLKWCDRAAGTDYQDWDPSAVHATEYAGERRHYGAVRNLRGR